MPESRDRLDLTHWTGGVPEPLRRSPLWVAWRYVERSGKWTKVPICAATGGPVNVSYDAAGNLTHDEADFGYEYDYENRLTKVTYESGGSTQLADFEYDALGRMIGAQVRYDADVNAVAETTKFYYDGSNVIAEYDMADAIQRRYVHGKRGIDERAVMLAGNYTTLDAYYYLMEDLDTVAGLVAKNGALVETYDHDAYGKVTIWGYRPVDMDRDGDVFSDDVAEIYQARSRTSRGRLHQGCALSSPKTATNQDRTSTTSPSGATHAHPDQSKRHVAPSNRLFASAPRHEKSYLLYAGR